MDLLAAMRIFLRVVERGSFSAAARDLGLSQATVSERIEKLERDLKARLLERTTRTLNVTETGAVFYERAKAAVEAADEARASAASAGGRVDGILRVAAPHGLGEVVLPLVLAELCGQHPGLRIDLRLNDHFVDPVMEGVDLSVRVGRIDDGNFVARRLGTVRRVLLASPAYLAAHGTPRAPADLPLHPFMRIAGFAADDRLPLHDAAGRAVDTPIRTAWSANHWRPLLEALLAGAGIGALHAIVCRPELVAGRLIELLPDYRFPPLEVHVIYQAGPYMTLKTRLALDLILARMPDLLLQAEARV